MRHSMQFTANRGVALIIVLLIVALVSILATEMGSRLQLQVKRVSNIKDSNQAYWYAMGAEQFAQKAIRELLEQDDGIISLEQPWNQEFAYPVEGGGIEAQLSDAQSCFNLNALRHSNPEDAESKEMLTAFKSLLSEADIGMNDYEADQLKDSLADWLDDDSNLRDYGAEDADYESLVNPYLAANTFMANKSELRLINGVKPSWLKKLMPLVCVLPANNQLRLNVNTIEEDKVAVLAAATGLSASAAGNIVSNRDNDGYDKVESFLAEPEISALNLNDTRKKWFTVKTEHFILHTKTRYNNATFRMTSLFKVADDKVSVIRREFGGIE